VYTEAPLIAKVSLGHDPPREDTRPSTSTGSSGGGPGDGPGAGDDVDPCWATVTTWPATVTAPWRAGPLLGEMPSWTAPAPSADAPSVTLIQESRA
jgi:hypothetical protein